MEKINIEKKCRNINNEYGRKIDIYQDSCRAEAFIGVTSAVTSVLMLGISAMSVINGEYVNALPTGAIGLVEVANTIASIKEIRNDRANIKELKTERDEKINDLNIIADGLNDDKASDIADVYLERRANADFSNDTMEM